MCVNEKKKYSMEIKKISGEMKDYQMFLEKSRDKVKIIGRENITLKNRIKGLGNKLQAQRKTFNLEKNDIMRERATFQGREKQYVAEIRKKDNSIKMLQDRLHELQGKKKSMKGTSSVVNTFEVKGQILKKGPKFYSEASQDFIKLIQTNDTDLFKKLRKENNMLRQNLNEFQALMVEIVNIRKAAFERNFGKVNNESEFLIEIKKELFSLSTNPLSFTTLEEMKSNISKFKRFMDKMDSYKFGVRLENYSEDDTHIDIEGIEDIKNLKKMKELIGKFPS